MNGLKLNHITKAHCLESILSEEVLRREGYGTEKIIQAINTGVIQKDEVSTTSGLDVQDMWRLLKYQYKNVGRYVWFTEEDDVNCIDGSFDIPKAILTFDSQAIAAKKWVDVMRRVSVRSNRSRKMVRSLNETARLAGDDITKWWVVEKDVPMSLCEGIRDFTKMAA